MRYIDLVRIQSLFIAILLGTLPACYQATVQGEPPDSAIQACMEQYQLKPFTHYFGLFYPTPPPGDLANTAKLDEGLYRGARPTHRGLCQLKQMGIKTVISLENLENVVEWEKSNSQKLGIVFINLPLSIFRAPTQQEIDSFFSTVADPKQQPVYFHCMQGSDRTGILGFLYRVTRQGWNFPEAYAELLEHGFHTYLFDLKHFIEQYQQTLPSE